MRVLVLGLGYTGQRLADQLLERDHVVVGTTTNPGEFEETRWSSLVRPFNLGKDRLDPLLEDAGWTNGESVSMVFTAGPPRLEDLDESLQLLEDLVDQIAPDRFRNVVYLSSTSVFGDRNGDWVDETAELDPVSRSGSLKMRSEQLLTDELDGVAPILVRPGGIYGPGRNAGERYLSEDYELVGNGEKWTNRIHVEDLARICRLGCELEEPEILNAVDGNPVRLRELVEFLYEETGRNPADISYVPWEEAEAQYSEMKLGLLKPSKRVSARRLREKYDFTFRYPTVYEGLKELLNGT